MYINRYFQYKPFCWIVNKNNKMVNNSRTPFFHKYFRVFSQSLQWLFNLFLYYLQVKQKEKEEGGSTLRERNQGKATCDT